MSRKTREEKQQIRALLQQDPAAAGPYTPENSGSPSGKTGRGLLFVVALLAVAAVVLGVLVALRVLEVDVLLDPITGFLAGDAAGATTAPLPETPDAGAAYVEGTFFLGDSNTVRLAHFGLVDDARVKALTGIGIEGARNHTFDGSTMVQAVAAQKPKRVLVILGTNDVSAMDTDTFVRRYRAFIEELQAASPGTDVIIGGLPPVGEGGGYSRLSTTTVKQFNVALLAMCREDGLPYLDTFAALAQDGAAAKPGYTEGDGVHLTDEALQALLLYYRTHAYGV